jgi:hypothetical protein
MPILHCHEWISCGGVAKRPELARPKPEVGLRQRGVLDNAHTVRSSAKEMIAVSMSHKAYAFDWSAFARDELHNVLLDALSSGDERGLIRYIEANRHYIKDRYRGGPLSDDWKDSLGNYDVHEFGDFALTRFYDPMENYGIDHYWLDFEHLPEADQAALLGTPFGPREAYFDPGRQGSYFQTPQEVVRSLASIRRIDLSNMDRDQRESWEQFEKLLGECAKAGSGLYVTF